MEKITEDCPVNTKIFHYITFMVYIIIWIHLIRRQNYYHTIELDGRQPSHTNCHLDICSNCEWTTFSCSFYEMKWNDEFSNVIPNKTFYSQFWQCIARMLYILNNHQQIVVIKSQEKSILIYILILISIWNETEAHWLLRLVYFHHWQYQIKLFPFSSSDWSDIEQLLNKYKRFAIEVLLGHD